jgi:hypothetical protein
MVDSVHADADVDTDMLTMKICVYNLSRIHPTDRISNIVDNAPLR